MILGLRQRFCLQWILSRNLYKRYTFVGELSLNGQICPISGVLPIVVAASKRGIKRCIVAQENVAEAAFVEQMEVVGCRNLEELFSI